MGNELDKLSGTVESVSFQNNDNGFTVLDIETCDGDIFVAVGTIGPVSPGEYVTLTGTWQVHSTYGKQFRAETCVRERPKTVGDQYTYLASGIIKGVREGTARKIIEKFGESTFDVIENEPERLAKIKGITLDKAREISKAFKAQFAMRETLISLGKYGFSSAECLKIFSVYGENSVSTIERNPYLIMNSGLGMSFDRADSIAERLPEKPDNRYRLSAGIVHVLNHNRNIGHSCIPRSKLHGPCSVLLGVEENEVETAIDELVSTKQVISEEVYGREFIFLPDLYRAEKNAAREMLFRRNFPPAGGKVTDARIKNIEVVSGIVFNELQRRAITIAVERGLLILTGGPGTGKTTTLRGILRLFEYDGIETVLAAPTGRAAKRMSELTGKEAKTIHRLLEVEFDKNDNPVFSRNSQNPIDAGAVIVDELSMVDSRLFASLLDALPIGCRLVLVGDSDQLPAVGAGDVLHDLIDSKLLPVVELNEVFRQAMESLIVTNAHRIVAGEMPEISSRDKDFFFMERRNAFAAASTICELCSSRLPDAYNYSPFEDIQVICPSHKGDTGTDSLNKSLQLILNPPGENKKEHAFGSRVFRQGDKVMQTKNNYDLEWESVADASSGMGIFNGDIGVIKKVDNRNNVMTIDFDDRRVEYPFESVEQLEHAYAITVHKSQGSEFRCVIMPMTGIVENLAYRNLLYTGVTRARENIILVGDKETLRHMVENNVKSKRYSALKGFILAGDDNGF